MSELGSTHPDTSPFKTVFQSRLLRLPEVIERTRLSRSTIYLRMKLKEASFPRPINLGPRTVVWMESEIEEWIEERIKASRTA